MKQYLRIICAVLVLAAVITVWLFVSGDESICHGEGFAVTLEVRADTLLENMHLLDRDKHELVPADGIIFEESTVTAHENESVFDVLNREMRNAGIHFVFRQTPLFDSAYIESINNLGEFDAGPLSGWKFRVNGEFLGMGASAVSLQPGDVVEWLFTVDMGRDIGAP
ncbi:MAG: DUF4430 domain-containing protein [Defluviitaleaceae bacterium]|nr:DUF4430 domain-containing protein [Defluviitaleaceae bacterium]